MEQVDAVVGATDTIALAAYKYYSEKEVMKPHQIYGFGGDPMTQLVSPSIKQFIIIILKLANARWKRYNRCLKSKICHIASQ